MKVCVGTVVHHPEDARIMHRQIRALLDAGHQVTYVAPFTHCNVTPQPEIRAIDVPRAVGLHRAKAMRAARSALKRGCADADLLLVHDIELLLALPRRRPVTVWDVHEDTVAALDAKPYLPDFARSTLPPLLRNLEARAERRLHLILAEESYRSRFTADHPVVPNHTYVAETAPPPPGESRVVYVGHISAARGAAEMVELAKLLRPHGIRLDLIGPADADVRPMLRDAQRTGLLDWFGYVPNRHALRMAQGALAGLSLLHDVPNYRESTPTKVIEYMAQGVPVITTPLPKAVEAMKGCGTVVPFGDVDAAYRAVLELRDDPARRAKASADGHAEARAAYHWPDRAPEFVSLLENWAAARGRVTVPGGHRAVAV